MKINYKLTYHAIERLQERFPQFCDDIIEFKNWNRSHGFSPVKYIFNQIFNDCNENKSYLNNTENMIKLYEKYGFESDYIFLELPKEDILFLLTKNRSEDIYTLVTIMPTSFRPLVKNIKYKAKTNENDLEDYQNEQIDNNQPSYIDNLIMKEKLIDSVDKEKAKYIETISKTQTKFKAIINDKLYDFIYSKNRRNEKNIEILHIKSIDKTKTKPKF